jgi:RNA polymerase primary sigma factor
MKKLKKSENQNERNFLQTYFNEINNIPLLKKEEENQIACNAAKGDQAARNKLINSNLRFVVSIAKKYQNHGLLLEDLIQEGNIGLINAINHYSIDRGVHFITYAVWWIKQAIIKALGDKSRIIRLPINKVNELILIQRARKYINSKSSSAEINEIAKSLKMNKNYIYELLNISREVVSLNNLVNNNSESLELIDVIVDNRDQENYNDDTQKSLEADLQMILNTLDVREAEIISMRYGLNNNQSMSLKEIGERYNISKERVRQIELKAMKNLMHPSRKRVIAKYVA